MVCKARVQFLARTCVHFSRLILGIYANCYPIIKRSTELVLISFVAHGSFKFQVDLLIDIRTYLFSFHSCAFPTMASDRDMSFCSFLFTFAYDIQLPCSCYLTLATLPLLDYSNSTRSLQRNFMCRNYEFIKLAFIAVIDLELLGGFSGQSLSFQAQN